MNMLKKHRFGGNIICLLCGFIIGLFISMYRFSDDIKNYTIINCNPAQLLNDTNSTNSTNITYSQLEFAQNVTNITTYSDETPIHQKLEKEVRVLCWVLTMPENHMKKALHVNRTWGSRCTKLLFMSSVKDDVLGTIALPVKEGRDHLWNKTKEALKYIYENHLDDADWFLKADDDTYVIMENLRYMLYPYSSEDPIYFGCTFKNGNGEIFTSGGPGYVLSKEAVRKFVVDGIPDKNKCRQDAGGAEDVEISKCLKNVGVMLGDSRDSEGRLRFFHLDPEMDLMPELSTEAWYWVYKVFPIKLGPTCCSDTPVSFHYIKPGRMYDLEYFFYRVQPYGIEYKTGVLPDKLRRIRD